jgi:hypothetical protein
MFRDDEPEWAISRVRIRAKHWGRDGRTDRVVTDVVRPLVIAMARQGVPARTLAPHFRQIARVDRRATSRAYAWVSAAGSTSALRWLARARARPPRLGRPRP